MSTIHLLWPTARPAEMRRRHYSWIAKSVRPDTLRTLVAVDTGEEASLLNEFKCVIIGEQRAGVVRAVDALQTNVEPNPDDIIVLASDDVEPPLEWDRLLRAEFDDFKGAIRIDDGYQYGGCVTVPILHTQCFFALNRIIYHPAYFHQYADAELFQNLAEIGTFKKTPLLFEHQHWACAKRARDLVDLPQDEYRPRDEATFHARMKLSLTKRLKR